MAQKTKWRSLTIMKESRKLGLNKVKWIKECSLWKCLQLVPLELLQGLSLTFLHFTKEGKINMALLTIANQGIVLSSDPLCGHRKQFEVCALLCQLANWKTSIFQFPLAKCLLSIITETLQEFKLFLGNHRLVRLFSLKSRTSQSRPHRLI